MPEKLDVVSAQYDELSALLGAILDAPSKMAIITTDAEFRINRCNMIASNLFGLTREDIIGRSIPDIHDQIGVDNERFYRAVALAIEHGEFRFTQKIQTPAGVHHHLDSRLIPLRGANGTLRGYMLLASDETQLVHAEDTGRKLTRAVEQSPVAIIITDTHGIIEYINARFTQTTGYSVEEAIGRPANLLRSGQTPPDTYTELWQTISAGKEWTGELYNRRKNGELYWDSLHIMPVIGTDHAISHFVSLQEDITARKQNEEKLRLWATVFENSGEAVMITDPDNRIVLVNKAFSDISGYTPAEVLGCNPHILGSGRHDKAFFQQMWLALQDVHHWQGEIWDRRKNGETYPKWLGITAVYNADGQMTHYVAIFSDISERKAAQDKIEYLAHHDPLTGLPNRLLVYDRFAQAAAHADRTHGKVALLFLDLDRFKTINDSLGHPAGDKLLQTLSARLQECVRDTDTISRQGGDEFLIIVPELRDLDTVAGVAQKILEHVRQPLEIDGHTLNASFSIGISLYPDDGGDFDTLLKKSDTAMYHAKDAGRNAYRFFTEQMNVDALERLLIQNRLRCALEQSEFILHYQPQIDLASGQIIGVEALVRWNNPELGLIGPNRFIPIAEETGQIVALGEWVLNEACRQAQAWRTAGLPALTMAVNVSAVQLQRGHFVDTVLAALAASGLDASALELELTESVLIQDVEKTLDTVRKLQSLGIKISIDDFGTGYSSLSYLKRFAIDRIKIDSSFVRDISNDPEDAAIVRAIIQMAHSLRLITLAEGAETQAQVDYLRREGCEVVQGFFYSRPLSAENFAEFLTEHNNEYDRH